MIGDVTTIAFFIISSEQDPPEAMVYLHELSETESGWLDVTQSLVDVIPIKDPLGPANITLLLDDSPIPAKVGWFDKS